MLEPADAYALARHLRDRGENVVGTEDVLARYAHAAWLTDGFPVFLLNTAGSLDVCVFLKEGRCSVYEARPRACRLYPFFIAPGSRGRDLQYLLCTEKSHHFEGGAVTVRDWLAQNFSKEARAALKADYEALAVIGRNLRAASEEQSRALTVQFLYYRYFTYELDQPFLPQFLSNLEKLEDLTGEALR